MLSFSQETHVELCECEVELLFVPCTNCCKTCYRKEAALLLRSFTGLSVAYELLGVLIVNNMLLKSANIIWLFL